MSEIPLASEMAKVAEQVNLEDIRQKHLKQNKLEMVRMINYHSKKGEKKFTFHHELRFDDIQLFQTAGYRIVDRKSRHDNDEYYRYEVSW